MHASSSNSRRRVRAKVMADDLGVSIRKFREIQTMGMPYTQVQGVLWFEPELVHKWLDKFARKGTPGIKRGTCKNAMVELNANRGKWRESSCAARKKGPRSQARGGKSNFPPDQYVTSDKDASAPSVPRPLDRAIPRLHRDTRSPIRQRVCVHACRCCSCAGLRRLLLLLRSIPSPQRVASHQHGLPTLSPTSPTQLTQNAQKTKIIPRCGRDRRCVFRLQATRLSGSWQE